MRERLYTLARNVMLAGKFSCDTKKKSFITVSISILLLVFLVLSSFPSYSLQMLGANSIYFFEVFSALTLNLYATAGLLGLITVLIYSIFTSVALVNMYTLVQIKGGWTALKGVGGVSPGFLIGSCAGCGAGILGFLGFTGALALLPFSGNGVRVVGILFLVYFLGKIGDPGECSL